MSGATLEADRIQGLVFSGYADLPQSAYVLARIENTAKATRWLEHVIERISHGRETNDHRAINLALSFRGLTRLNAAHGFVPQLSPAFVEGIAGSPRRSRILGDDGDNDPAKWTWGGPDDDSDLLVLVFAQDEAALANQLRELSLSVPCASTTGLRTLRVLGSYLLRDGAGHTREHFGFRDGISNPILDDESCGRPSMHRIPAGEIVLGYRDGSGRIAAGPSAPAHLDPDGILPPAGERIRDFGKNGTYLVLRQLAEDVQGFWRFVDHAAVEFAGVHGENRERLAAQIVGRRPDGTPLAECESAESGNEFGFAHDPLGALCPIGAHIRRANPRDSLPFRGRATSVAVANRHRIVRRSRVYGRPVADRFDCADAAERGLLFLALNASIERQFETIQQRWINDPGFGGLYRERDPLVGSHPSDGGSLTIGTSLLRRRLHGIPRFVTVRGGGYFFLPGLPALRYLAARR